MNNLKGISTTFAQVTAQLEDFNFTGYLVMLVDDTPFNIDIAQELLEMAGLKVICATNGKEAVELFEQSKPETYDLILMDVQMPIMGGYAATRAIRAMNRPDAGEITIVAMTANSLTEDVMESFAAGMNDHLIKPIDSENLYKTLEKYLKYKM